MDYTRTDILNQVKSLPSFDGIPKGFWIVGIRSDDDAPDQYDDMFCLFWNELLLLKTTGTTHAGTKALKNYQRYNKNGTFVMKADEWYYDLWKFGYHNGRMAALKQNKPVIGYRDSDRDDRAEEGGMLYEGYFGINFHTVSYDKKANFIRKFIGGWSAGCQVLNNVDDYYTILNKVRKQPTTTYVLLNEF